MSATTASLAAMREHLTKAVAEAIDYEAGHNSACQCGNSVGIAFAAVELSGAKDAVDLEDRIAEILSMADQGLYESFGPETVLSVRETIDEARVVAGQVLRPDGTVADRVTPVSSWDSLLSLFEPGCPRCGHGIATGSTWPSCVHGGEHRTWCGLRRYANDVCGACADQLRWAS